MTDSPAANLREGPAHGEILEQHGVTLLLVPLLFRPCRGHLPPFSLGFGFRGGFWSRPYNVSGGFGMFRGVSGRFGVGGERSWPGSAPTGAQRVCHYVTTLI
jgi:hypothetical protein